jgi:hypothetical protein
VAQGLHRSYNDCLKEEEEDKLQNAATIAQSALLNIQQ